MVCGVAYVSLTYWACIKDLWLAVKGLGRRV